MVSTSIATIGTSPARCRPPPHPAAEARRRGSRAAARRVAGEARQPVRLAAPDVRALRLRAATPSPSGRQMQHRPAPQFARPGW